MPIPRRQNHRYLCMKWDDVAGALSPQDMDQLGNIIAQVNAYRAARQKPERNYVCVSDKNRSLHDEVWGMVLADVVAEQRSQRAAWTQQLNASLNAFQNRLNGRTGTGTITAAPVSTATDEMAEDEDYALEAAPVEEAEEAVANDEPVVRRATIANTFGGAAGARRRVQHFDLETYSREIWQNSH